MKMKSKFFGNGAKLALAVLAVCGTLFTSCYEKAEVDEATKPAPAKYYIAGTITDATTGQVLTTAKVTLGGESVGATFNKEVTYKAEGYSLEVSATGYYSVTRQVYLNQVSDGQTSVATVDVALVSVEAATIPPVVSPTDPKTDVTESEAGALVTKAAEEAKPSAETVKNMWDGATATAEEKAGLETTKELTGDVTTGTTVADPQGWSISSLDSCLFPRYLSAMGAENEDYLLIMGGYGNQSGKQEESPGNFYDLYRLNLKTGKCAKLWEFVNDRQHFTFGNSMIVDTPSNSVYALTYNNDRYNTFVYLSRFDIQTRQPVQEVMSDSIVYNFLDIHSYCDMFLHKETSSIYAVVLQEKEPGISKVEFYKLAFPPLSREDILPHQTGGMKPVVLISGILAGLLCLIGGSIWLLHSKRKRKVNVSVGPVATEEVKDRLVEEEPTEQKVSSVLLLGGFQIFDKQGGNITGDFTPTLKQLFLFLLLNTIKNGKGTTSQCLDETFWFDMSKSSASNNRNVNIRKLRLIIEKIGDINIANKNGYWYLNLGKDVTCDYQEVMRLLDQIKDKDTITDKKIINKIISLASAGALLPNVSAEWIDEYKSAYYVLLTEILLSVVNRPDIKEDSRLLLKISDVILLVDNIDEDAIRTKCRVLYQMGQKGLSKQSFDKFCIEYERLLNAKPDFSYDDIINSL